MPDLRRKAIVRARAFCAFPARMVCWLISR